MRLLKLGPTYKYTRHVDQPRVARAIDLLSFAGGADIAADYYVRDVHFYYYVTDAPIFLVKTQIK